MFERSLYLKAIEVLQQLGWCQETYQDTTGACCLAGALNIAAGECSQAPWAQMAELPSLEALLLYDSGEHMPMAHYNDLPQMTKEKIIKVLHRAAETPSAATNIIR